jgi:putative membrane protein
LTANEDSRQKAGLSDYLAAERTLLAWIRTGLAMMGFGFVVARFGIFLQEVQVVQYHSSGGSLGLSLWFGTALIASGVLVCVSAGFHHLRLVRELDRGEAARPHSAFMAVLVALFLACIGIGMMIYLISIRSQNPSAAKSSQERSMTTTNENGMMTFGNTWPACGDGLRQKGCEASQP